VGDQAPTSSAAVWPQQRVAHHTKALPLDAPVSRSLSSTSSPTLPAGAGRGAGCGAPGQEVPGRLAGRRSLAARGSRRPAAAWAAVRWQWTGAHHLLHRLRPRAVLSAAIAAPGRLRALPACSKKGSSATSSRCLGMFPTCGGAASSRSTGRGPAAAPARPLLASRPASHAGGTRMPRSAARCSLAAPALLRVRAAGSRAPGALPALAPTKSLMASGPQPAGGLVLWEGCSALLMAPLDSMRLTGTSGMRPPACVRSSLACLMDAW
jgi:hypothetical protein